jgi:TusA-related sulfurtransferase
MKAILKSGETIELVKDCNCLTHDGPHWLHFDDTYKSQNKKLLQGERPCPSGFAIEEIARLNMKTAAMSSRNIVELID